MKHLQSSGGGETRKSARLIRGAALVMMTLGALSYGTLAYLRAPQTTPVMRGKEIADRLGCFGCHGPGGMGGRSNPGSVEGEVPPLRAGPAFKFFVRNKAELREWILDGSPERFRQDDELHRPGVIGMPGYRGYLSDEELGDLMAYVCTVSGTAPPLEPIARRGYELAQKNGCFTCHGMHGGNGLANPGSFKGVIPPWSSADYELLVENEAELREWIRVGMIERFATNPMARFFTDRQVIQMPAFREQITDRELDELVAYVNWTRDVNRSFAAVQDSSTPVPEGQSSRSVVQRGKYLFRATGCATCHGAEGRGGVPNPNAAGGYVPALDFTAERLQLFEPEEIEAVVEALDRGLMLDELRDDPPVEYFDDVLDAYYKLQRVILAGNMPAKRDSEKGTPPMRMPAWHERRHADAGPSSLAEIDAIVAYLLTLQPLEGTK